ncbi:hypothetical protein [Microbacterium sp.]|uniref:hypothetical protein n=1 Tax=Microbacterium sp. TaxID=51671 RepID=UPI003A8E0E8F
MTPSLTPLPRGLGDGFTVAQARQAGVSARRVRHLSLERPFRGVRMVSAAPPPIPAHDESAIRQEAAALTVEITRVARAFALVAPDGSFFSHVTAAVLWNLPVPIRLLRATVRETRSNGHLVPARGIDVATLGRRRSSKAAGVRGRQISANHVIVSSVDGLPVSSPASTWAMLAAELTVDELVEMGDAIVYIPRKRGMKRGTEDDALGTIADLMAAASTPRRAHRDRLLQAGPLVRVGSASPAETRGRLGFERAGLPTPELDYDVIAADGTAIGFTEFAFVEFALLVECEGDHHRTDRTQWYRDIDKHAACEDAGWRVLRLTSKHLYPTTGPAVERVRTALIRAGWHA